MSEDVKPYGAGGGPPADETTPEELRALIARTGLSQRRAAEALGMGERQMRYMAAGDVSIPITVIYALRYLASQVPPPRVRKPGPLVEAQKDLNTLEALVAAGAHGSQAVVALSHALEMVKMLSDGAEKRPGDWYCDIY